MSASPTPTITPTLTPVLTSVLTPVFTPELIPGPSVDVAQLRAELARLQAELADARQHLAASERLAELGTLTGGLAHEIKNPLSTVQLNLQLLGEDIHLDWPSANRVVSRLKTVQRETARLREILDDFLRYAGKLELDLQAVDLQPLIEDLVDFFHPQAELAGVKIRVRPAAGYVSVRADPRLIKQTVLNLMLNALQAMPDGGDLILSASVEGPWGLLHVTDTGSGISTDRQAKVFDAYYSTKKGGTGLGLAMSRRIIREHGGEIHLASEEGKGTDFILRLPLVK